MFVASFVLVLFLCNDLQPCLFLADSCIVIATATGAQISNDASNTSRRADGGGN